MRKSAIVVLLALVGIAAFWSGEQTGTEDTKADARREDPPARTEEIVRTRSAARIRGAVVVTPCSAAGRVVDAGGRGIVGALVLLRSRRAGEPSGATEAPITARTDGAGDWSVPGLAPGRYVLSATAAGFLPGSRDDLSLQSGDANAGLDLTLTAGGHPLRGTVHDISGGPVEGAVVTIERRGEGNLISAGPPAIPAISDAEGRFEARVADGVYRVEAWHADYATDSEIADVDGGPRSVTLRLVAAASVEGTVRTNQDGRPVAGAIVGVGESFEPGAPAAVADERGRFRLTGLRSGPYALRAMAAGHASGEPERIELGIGEALTDVELRVDRAFKISGFVAAKDDPGRALAEVMVAAYSLHPPVVHLTHRASEADGYFEIFGVTPGVYALGSAGEAALPEMFGPSVTVVDADVAGVVVQLDRGAWVRGRVEPPAPAAVTLALVDEDQGFLALLGSVANALVRSRADARGEFHLRPVKPGRLRVVAEAPDGSRGETEVEVGADGLAGVVVALEPRATVTGRVVDAAGAPLRGGSVEFLPRKRKPAGIFDALLKTDDPSGAPIGEDGQYVARGLDGGEYEVRVLDGAGNVIRWPDSVDRRYQPVRRNVTPAMVTHGVDLTVEVRDGVVRGVVVDGDGLPIADAWVTATPERTSAAEAPDHKPAGERVQEKVGAVPAEPKSEKPAEDRALEQRGEPVLSDSDGRFEVTGLAQRTYTLRAEALAGSARAKVAGVAPGTAEVRLQVVPLAALAGNVRAGGVPVARYELHARHARGGGFSSVDEHVRDASGAFQLDHLDPGGYVLTALADEGRAEQKVELRAGEAASVRIDLEAWGTARGVLVDARSQEPLSGVSVGVFGKDKQPTADLLEQAFGTSPETDAHGRFELARVPPGASKLSLYEGDRAGRWFLAQVPLTIAPGEVVDLGTIGGIPRTRIPKDERGDLGMRTRVATETRRPRALGVEPEPLTEQDDPTAPRRLWVRAVTIDGPSDRAGLLPGDEIVAVEGRGVAGVGVDNAVRLLARANIRRGQTVTLEVAREGARETIVIEAGPLAP